uniref:Uncharacterized protein n=1 Tax=Candidatus Methanogaster sp. ANME-2c ERB4 TaxID=2759911 RepID=A0A7G9YLP0_9EURY|nr:hypothetical protein MOGPJHGO_00027 [Methanosarcinales archaeon ANME-2c ERB4]
MNPIIVRDDLVEITVIQLVILQQFFYQDCDIDGNSIAVIQFIMASYYKLIDPFMSFVMRSDNTIESLLTILS